MHPTSSLPYTIVYLHGDSHAGENYGNHLQRVLRPCELWINDLEFSVRAVPITDLDACDRAFAADLLVIIQTFAVPLAALIRQRRLCNRPTVFEINDDLAFVGDWLAYGHGIRSPLTRQHLLNLAHACDALQVSSAGLAQRYHVLHNDAYVLEPYVPVPSFSPEKPQGFVIGWTGTTSHIEDLKDLIPVLRRFLQTHPDSQFAAMGNLAILREILSDLPAAQLRLRAFGDYADLQDFLADVHIAIAPLQDTGFNQGRSDGKFAQYAAAACVALLSDHPVFAAHKQHARLFANSHELLEQLQQLYGQRAQLDAIARPGLEWVRRERSPQAVRENMRMQFRHWLGDRKPLPEMPHFHYDANQRAYWKLALDAARNTADEDCRCACQTLLAQNPACHTARILLLQQFNRQQDYASMLTLIDCAPQDLFFADQYATMGYAIAKKIKPERSADYLHNIQSCALRTQAVGVTVAGLEPYFRQILSELPYDYFALFGLHKILHKRDPCDPELPDLERRMDLLAPDALTAEKS